MKLSPAVLRTLRALDAAEHKRLPFSDLRRASGVKPRAFGSVLSRMEDSRLVSRDHDKIHLTFAGMRALTPSPPSQES